MAVYPRAVSAETIPNAVNTLSKALIDVLLSAERKMSRTDHFATPIVHESKARCIAVVIERLASNDLKVALRPLVSGSDVPTIQTDNHFFTWFTLRSHRKGIRRLL
jgi:hypothetical protein